MIPHIRKYFITLLFLIPLIINAQNGTVTGNVTDEYGPIPGVKIAIEGELLSTKTDINGNYLLAIPAKNHTITASFITYQSQKKRNNYYQRRYISCRLFTQISIRY